MNITIIRNNQTYGPYAIEDVQRYVNHGTFLKYDIAYTETDTDRPKTVGYYLKKAGLRTSIEHEGNLFSQLGRIGRKMAFPFETLRQREWSSDTKLLILALVGLLPLAFGTFLGTGCLMFYAISLYFAAIWGMFFYTYFKTSQVRIKTTLIIFFLTQACVFVVFGLALNYLNVAYFLGNSNSFILKMLFFVLGVGVTEELVKSIPLYLISSRAREPLFPQTLVFYGLISGIAFGVFEGVEYQLGVNAEMEYGESFFSNIARLTSLPFLHATWCGIAGYFIAFARLYPKYRLSLYFLALSIPASLHGLYDTFTATLGGIGIILAILTGLFGVIMLMTYLRKGSSNRALFKE